MNIRKNIDYSRMYAAIDDVMSSNLPQMQLYCSIGKIVCTRSEKGAAVMASEYIIANYPDAKGFSPRSLRRMRDFYRTYESYPALLSRAMQLGWIQNVVIMEADLTMELREWYMKAAKQFSWSKTELIANITTCAHNKISLFVNEETNNILDENIISNREEHVRGLCYVDESIYQIKIIWRRIKIKRGRKRRCHTIPDSYRKQNGINKILGKIRVWLKIDSGSEESKIMFRMI